MLRRLLALTAIAAGAAAHAQQCDGLDDAVREELMRLASISPGVEYSGVVTLQRGPDMQVLEVSHRTSGEHSEEQLSRMGGERVQIRRAGHGKDCVHPGHQLLLAAADSAPGVCELARHYRFELLPSEPVVGRDALRLRAEPLDMYRFGHVFDIDRESAILLRSTTLARDQRVIEQYQFASLSLAPVAAEDDSSTAAGPGTIAYETQHPHPQESAHLRLGDSWSVSWLPEGFVATDAAPPESQRKSYTDGLASFSVFLEPLSRPLTPGEGVERQGSTVAYTRGMVLRGQPVLVTVLGEIPTNTARMLADSVRMR